MSRSSLSARELYAEHVTSSLLHWWQQGQWLPLVVVHADVRERFPDAVELLLAQGGGSTGGWVPVAYRTASGDTVGWPPVRQTHPWEPDDHTAAALAVTDLGMHGLARGAGQWQGQDVFAVSMEELASEVKTLLFLERSKAKRLARKKSAWVSVKPGKVKVKDLKGATMDEGSDAAKAFKVSVIQGRVVVEAVVYGAGKGARPDSALMVGVVPMGAAVKGQAIELEPGEGVVELGVTEVEGVMYRVAVRYVED